MKKVIAVLKNKDFQKLLASTTVFVTGFALVLKSSQTMDMKQGAKAVIQVAEEMQPGFKDALDAFIKSKYGLNA